MKKVAILGLLALAMIFSYGVSGVFAQDAKAPEAVGVTVTGVNYGLLSSLAKGEAASANGALAQMNALKVTEAKTADGAAIAELAGKTLYYLPSKTADAVITGEGLRGKNVTVIGKLFKNEGAILVEEIQSEGGDAGGDDWDMLPTGKKSQLQVL
jgi:hypothetical protein